ncbi:MAG TPA: hypothetical protein HPP95_05580 [Deltaproteobacteria bacterium]|nr:hypothetical protein [Deltaproteobacteria bacterium]
MQFQEIAPCRNSAESGIDDFHVETLTEGNIAFQDTFRGGKSAGQQNLRLGL